MPEISLVMTTYNRFRYVPEAVKSVLQQTFHDFEFVILDDGSTDRDLLEFLDRISQEEPRVRVYKAEHSGRGQALKQALDMRSDSVYLGWVDSDDILHGQALEKTVEVMNILPSCGMVYSDCIQIDARSMAIGQDPRSQLLLTPDNLSRYFIPFQFRLIRNKAYELVGGINSEFSTIEDYEFCLRLAKKVEIVHLASNLYFYRVHQDSICTIERTTQIKMLQKIHRISYL